MCTALARMLSWSCISVHSVLGQHQVCPCLEVLVCTAVAGLVDSSSTDCLHSTHEPQEGEPFGVVLMNSESFRVLRSCFEFRRIVNASRIPPRPLAGQRLEAAGQQLKAWKAPLESSWRRLGVPRTSSGELLEALGRAGGGPGGVLGGSGAALEPFKRCLGSSPGRLGAVLRAPDVRLEPSGSQKGSKMEPKRVPNRAPEATRAENGKTLIIDDSTKDFNDFSCLRAPFWS